MPTSLYLLLSIFFLAPAFADSDYCVGIRGNGELAPAHWSGMARLVEENGIPQAMAGGSSATVTMFFLDSIAGNPAVKRESNPEKKRQMQALLLKSLPEFVATMAHNEKMMSAWEMMSLLSDKNSPLSERVKKALASTDASIADMQKAFAKYESLLNPELLRNLNDKPERFRAEALQSAAVFGKFDAQKDANLFFRPGVVDFKTFALLLGRIGDFYAGNADPEVIAQLDDFLQNCSETAFRKQWKDVPAEGCKKNFQKIVASYLDRGQFQDQALFQSVGYNVPSLPTTAVIQGEGMLRYNEMKRAFQQGEESDYAGFAIDYGNDLSFGYWGSRERLAQVNLGLQPFREVGDEKSKKFRALGPANWFEVLSISPAEPGLANFQQMPTGTTREKVLAEHRKSVLERWAGLSYRDDMLSAGGWSDLHPVLVLAAQGCKQKNIVYLTRQDGDSVFGQQVFIRLTGQKESIPFWNRLGEQNNEGWQVTGSAAESPWNKIYNLGNRESSLQRALRVAGAVYCTNWNRFDLFKGQMWPLVEDAYSSPVFLRPGAIPALAVNPPDAAGDSLHYPGCVLEK